MAECKTKNLLEKIQTLFVHIDLTSGATWFFLRPVSYFKTNGGTISDMFQWIQPLGCHIKQQSISWHFEVGPAYQLEGRGPTTLQVIQVK